MPAADEFIITLEAVVTSYCHYWLTTCGSYLTCAIRNTSGLPLVLALLNLLMLLSCLLQLLFNVLQIRFWGDALLIIAEMVVGWKQVDNHATERIVQIERIHLSCTIHTPISNNSTINPINLVITTRVCLLTSFRGTEFTPTRMTRSTAVVTKTFILHLINSLVVTFTTVLSEQVVVFFVV